MTSAVTEIGRLIAADDYEHCTAEPLFLVQRKRREYGYDPDYVVDIAWLDNEGVEADAETFKRLEASVEDGYGPPADWRRTAYVDRWEFVTLCFTKSAAEAYIEAQKHNLGEARVYVDSAVRNPEMKAIRHHLVNLRAAPIISERERALVLAAREVVDHFVGVDHHRDDCPGLLDHDGLTVLGPVCRGHQVSGAIDAALAAYAEVPRV